MVDYTRLAENARAVQDAAKLATERQRKLEADPSAFFERVTACILDEMNKANVELRKKGVHTIDRNHLPNFQGVIFLAFGTESLCRVELEILAGGFRIKAVMSGPNGFGSTRKEYVFGQRSASMDLFNPGGSIEAPGLGARPEKIAEEIISGILVGNFD